MKAILMLPVALLLAAGSAFAAPSCYTPTELQAEQLLRLHSELMVITVTCRVGSQGENLVPAYTGFTKNHVKDLHEAEQTMKAYYARHGGNGQDRLDVLRTRLGNEYGQKIANMSAQPFCDAYRDKVLIFANASNTDVMNEVQRMETAEKPYVNPCTRVAKNKKGVGG